MIPMIRRLTPLLLLAAWLPAVLSPAAHAQEGQAERQHVVVHLSHYSDDLHAVQMALALATSLQDGGASVTLFLDLEGVRLADSRVPADLGWGRSGTVAERYDGFVEAGGKVVLCAHCSGFAGVTAAVLREGATIGTDDEVRQLFMAADKVIDF